MTRRILITGGPVHAYLDAVKLVTNRFKGGLMAGLAADFARDYVCEVTYLCAKGSTVPPAAANLQVVQHDGFDEYRRLVSELAKTHTDVILGAAVANLIPANPWKGKFPSHNYQPGDIVSVDFMVAPRIIDEVKKAAPHVNLFGFKLLSGVDHEELVRAAYGIVLEAKATAVIANDAKDLQQKFIVTRERGVHPVHNLELAGQLWAMMCDEHYRSEVTPQLPAELEDERRAFLAEVQQIAERNPRVFVEVEGGLLFGTVAKRRADGVSFWTTARGKRELEQAVLVTKVDHQALRVFTQGERATLNAPLLARIFEAMPEVQTIVHGHVQVPSLPTLPYAPPGTVRDSQRDLSENNSFNIAEHGCFFLLDKDGRLTWNDERRIWECLL